MFKQPESVRRKLATGQSMSCNDDDDFVECVSDSRSAMTKSLSAVSSDSGCIEPGQIDDLDGGFIREETESDHEESGPDGDEQENADDDGSLCQFDGETDTGISPQSSSRKARAQWVVLGTYSKKMSSLAMKQTVERVFTEEMRIATSDIILSDDFMDYKLCKKIGNFVRSNVRCQHYGFQIVFISVLSFAKFMIYFFVSCRPILSRMGPQLSTDARKTFENIASV